MNLLQDEQLSPKAAPAFAALLALSGGTVAHIGVLGYSGMDDGDIPELCRRLGFDTLLTINVKDFGARLHYYAALVDAGINVVVGRPGKGQRMDAYGQVGLFAQHLPRIEKNIIEGDGAVVLQVVTQGSVRARTLSSLVEELESKRLP